jgi:archaellum component FlaC
LAERLGQVRKLFQDLIAPELGRLDERVTALVSRCDDIAREVEWNRNEIKDVWSRLQSLGEKIGHVEGRLEGVKREIVADVQLTLLKQQQRRPEKRTLLPPSDE